MLGTEVKNNTIDVHLDGVFVENPLIFVILHIGRGGDPSLRPPWYVHKGLRKAKAKYSESDHTDA